jgi:uncharacterized repeat protein (TIGR01451 family)
VQATLSKTLQTSPANLDLPETYRLRISVPNSNGALNLTAIGPVVDTLPPGTVFNGATPAADCQPGCVGTTPATLTWTSPCTLPLAPGGNCDITVNVVFPSATFPSGTNVTNSFTADVTPLGQPPQNLGVGTVTHPVTTFVPAPGMGFSKNMAGGTPNPPTLNQTFSYDFNVSNSGNVVLDNPVIIDTLPVELQVLSVTTGAYNNLSSFAVGEGVRVSYEKNTALGTFTLWGSSPNTTTNTTLTAPPPGLGAGEYLTRIRWEYGQAAVRAWPPSTRTGRDRPDRQPGQRRWAGGYGRQRAELRRSVATYTAGPTNGEPQRLRDFNVSGPFVQLNPAKDNLSGGGPFNPGQNGVLAPARAHGLSIQRPGAARGIDRHRPAAGQSAVHQLDLRRAGHRPAGAADLRPDPELRRHRPHPVALALERRQRQPRRQFQQVWININTTIRNGTPSGSLGNDFTLDSDAPGLGQRCSGTNARRYPGLDGDADTSEQPCAARPAPSPWPALPS